MAQSFDQINRHRIPINLKNEISALTLLFLLKRYFMIRLLVGCLGFFALFLTSCMDLETSNQLEKIASMNKTIDSIETVFNANKFDSLKVMSLTAYTVENRIKNNYHSDTINIAFGQKMDAFKVMRRSLRPCSKSKSLIPTTIAEERQKLKELREDIENGNGDREKYEEYVKFEEAKVGQLRAVITDYVTTKNTAIKTYNDYYKELNDFSLSLLKK